VRIVVGLLCLGMIFGAAAVAAQEAECAPVEVGDGTGVYFLALGDNCTTAQADGYTLISHLVRDDDSSEVLLVLIDDAHDDADTQEAAQVLSEQVKNGGVDGGTWHAVNDEPPG
jgi:hypothetical protein